MASLSAFGNLDSTQLPRSPTRRHATMSNIGRDHGSKDEVTTDEDGARDWGKGMPVITTNEYLDRVVGRKDDDDVGESSGEEAEIDHIRFVERAKRKRKAGEKVEWSEDEGEENIYERFKNRKKAKRKKVAETKKLIKAKAKDAADNRKTKANGEDSSKGKERIWDEEPDYSMLDDEIPEYIRKRRSKFDKGYKELEEAGLRLPPRLEEAEFSENERLKDLEERPDLPDPPSREYRDIELPTSAGIIPASVAQYLRDYQVEGVAFMHELFVYQKGGILGDDMGLGKTIQVVAFLTAAFGKAGDERDAKRMREMRRSPRKPWYPRVMVICPGTLIDNWKNEFTKWGWWHVGKFHGSAAERDSVFNAAATGFLEILITTYSTYRNHKSQLNIIEWDCVVADECHQIKDGAAAITKAMNEVNALCRIGLTGTAVQNKYAELWTLLNWTNPGKLGPLTTWESCISKPLRMGQSHDATYHQLKQARSTAKRLKNNLLPQFFLRRMKTLLAKDLPKKTDKVVFCPLTEIQREAYEYFLESSRVELVKDSTLPCDCNSGKKRGWCCYTVLPDSNTKWQALVFPFIATLQKLSNHLALLIPRSDDPKDKQQRDLEFLQEMVPDRWEELYENRDSLHNLANPDFCGKWKVLKKLLKFWHGNGDKVLIFSFSVRLLKMLEHLFYNTTYNVSFLSGDMAMEDRQRTVDDFNSDPNQFVFLISTKAGGVGLNITSANKVVIFDPNWNPSYDLQAQDRAYRIGQTRNVEVYRLVSAGTVEEIVYARQIYKQQQANIAYDASLERRYFKGVQDNSAQKGEIFGLDNLLKFHADEVVLRDIVNKTNVAETKLGIAVLEFNAEDAANDEDNPLAIDDDDKEDGAMSQLAALVTEGDVKKKKPKPKRDAIQAILAEAGVEYTHENSEVIGSSKVEAELSRRAEEAGNDADFGEAMMFSESQLGASDPEKIHYQFHPPEDVTMRQFCTMAKTFGFGSASEFALVVEGWTQKQRTSCLEHFYLKRKEKLASPDAKAEEGEEKRAPDSGNAQDISFVTDIPLDSFDPDSTADVAGTSGLDTVADSVDTGFKVNTPVKVAITAPINDDDETTEDDDDEL